ncbi:MAG: hypothetical protein MJ117_08335 [Lachnospiraceae bacterium]|nr:hypothetical protein [Lachnospiraceae bacterium]
MASKAATHAGFDAPGDVISEDTVYEFLPIEYTEKDIQIIRELAKKYMSYATLPCQEETIKLWEKVNDLERARPVLWHNDLPFYELKVGGELTLITSSPFTQRIEEELRNRIYIWEHIRGDAVLEPVFYSPMIIRSSGIGLDIVEETVQTDANNSIVGHKYVPTLVDWDDIEKIKDPVITVDEEQTKATYDAYCTIFGDTMPVEIKGAQGFWYTPMDDVVQYMGTTAILENIMEDPDFVHACMKRIVEVDTIALDQYEKLGAIASNNKNFRIGSGGYGYSSKLGRGKMTGMKTSEMWGACASQYFTTVSPAMHNEFSLQYEIPWLERFAYSYYGCCERMDHKMDYMRQVKNLRKVTCSPWNNTEHMAEVCGRDYVVSLKPSPACFAYDTFDEQMVRDDIKTKLNYLKDCNVEILIKDISTVRYEPERLWRWMEIVHEMIVNMD